MKYPILEWILLVNKKLTKALRKLIESVNQFYPFYVSKMNEIKWKLYIFTSSYDGTSKRDFEHFHKPAAAVQRCYEKVSWNCAASLQENTHDKVWFYVPNFLDNVIKKPAQSTQEYR